MQTAVAPNLPFATYHPSANLIVPTNLKKQKEILKSSQLTKQGTQFTFAVLPCQNKDRKSCALLGGLNHSSTQLYQRQERSSSFPHGSLEPSFPGECSTSLHRHARASSTQTNLPLQGPSALLLNTVQLSASALLWVCLAGGKRGQQNLLRWRFRGIFSLWTAQDGRGWIWDGVIPGGSWRNGIEIPSWWQWDFPTGASPPLSG